MTLEISKYLTPYKSGKPVLTGSGKPGRFDSMAVDCPFVFYHRDKFYMMYVGFDGKGYQTGLAVSNDLVNWKYKGLILKREEHVGWDSVGAAGTCILRSTNNLYELPTLKKIDGKYWMTYYSYPEEGYESGAARMGLAWTEDEDLLKWHRVEDPIFSWEDGDEWDRGGLYNSCFIEYDGTYYLYYNAKNETYKSWVEQIGIATSKDMINWKRYERNPVLKIREGKWDSKFCANPFVVQDGDKWLMFYYGFDGKHAQEGLAISDDLFCWERYPEPILTHGSPGELDEKHAHKPSIIFYKGVLYHFYCACRKYKQGDPAKNLWDEFRCITVATSKPLSM